jgi:hypothetical protein
MPCLQALIALSVAEGIVMDEPISAEQRELLIVREQAMKKRRTLLTKARRIVRRRRHLQVASGVMALLSGSITAAVFAEVFGQLWIKIGVTLLTFSSGLLTLILNAYASNKDADDMFRGAARFSSIHDRAYMESERVYENPQQRQKGLAKVKAYYQNASKKFDRHLPVNFDSQHRGIGLGKKTRPLI